MSDPGAAASEAEARLARAVPAAVAEVIDRFHDAGHAAYLVGGSLRDVLLGMTPDDWDMATDALPERVIELFPRAVYENRFGTVGVRGHDDVFEVTTFRSEHDYADFRRPHRVEFGTDLRADLARRDFTVNALAWGRARPGDDDADTATLVDPYGGLGDLDRRLLRAVGDPDARFREDALRMVRAVRLAATHELTIEPATLAAIRANAPLVGHLSGERLGAELERLLAAPQPSVGLRLALDTGLLAGFAPELAAQRGIAQNKIPGDDLWDHTLRTVDAAPRDRPIVRLAALLHDIGKPETLAEGRFHHHESAGADVADALLHRLRVPTSVAERVVHLVRHHMFIVDPNTTDTAVRRFIKRIGKSAIDELFALREADDIGSGHSAGDPELAALRARIEAEIAAQVALDRSALRIGGRDLIEELGLEPGPRLGTILDALVERVIADPVLNDRPTLLLLAQAMVDDGQSS